MAANSGRIARAQPFDVAHDGQRFIITLSSNLSPSPITVVTNWTAALKKK